MNRRHFTSRALALAGACLVIAKPLYAHTPYGQWKSFRQRHLQFLTARSDLVGDSVADSWVAVLKQHLPSSRAIVSRARNFVRVASLLKTDQAKLGVLSYEQANAMFSGAPPFDGFAPMPLQLLLDNGEYLLVARDDLPLEHGYLLTVTLMEHSESLTVSVPVAGKFGMTIHPGARYVAEGKELSPRQTSQ